MELKIFWTDFAKAELNKIYKYLKENASLEIAKNENKKIVQSTLRLSKQPEIGQIEPMLIERKMEFKYLLHQTYKIIYWVNFKQNRIEIMDVFETYQQPKKIKRTK
ncbi:MAG: type II toxin-antitoxin system RelE/ParE family toxin [Flavobacteriia bacterium]|nr:type II toxin-antitoxin system RelE/ParE family toxin [Flavobacteriia bacterium]OIP48024.1 MAG: plasmid stabilization protein [Flavobacteriaceae bacterium CG2_30_31_66]PIV96181.1 MAG: type II toxin-antitoxin system RelE/ParE family toxin [Flavobacteriaceae bacterium CG17_big_fil_post_rev_8_21_14_2_50_31_13]PIX13913.1 MAG: type II toxin-antitoxin system RelE/ParE family toxin [Flavobacteriaceae bacterium CG_4_8_14_3_um_filter_31_8]PIY14397.1 MAG: type II toxin-antitoxin system RelE/ParE famil